MTSEQIQQMKESQGKKCKICEKRPAVAVDHCHKTGKVRGALCGHCNSAIGFMLDDPNILRNAANYLEDFEKVLKRTSKREGFIKW